MPQALRGGRLQNLSTPVERIAATSCARFRPGAGRGEECSTSPTLFGPTVRAIAARQRPTHTEAQVKGGPVSVGGHVSAFCCPDPPPEGDAESRASVHIWSVVNGCLAVRLPARPLESGGNDTLVNEDEWIHQRVRDARGQQRFEDIEPHHRANPGILDRR